LHIVEGLHQNYSLHSEKFFFESEIV
jgi:hypothetical protein